MKNRTKIYTVSQVNSLIKGILETNLPGQLVIAGEITDWKRHHSGHCYFSLKDEEAVLPCVMWRSNFGKVKFEPENGMAVLGTGFIDVYEPQGKYQFYVERMEPFGIGALQLAFEQMVKRLQKQGLFDEEHKKPIPEYPERIGILTSESGAAIEDIKDSIWNRWPCVKLFLYPVPVQGEGAAAEIAAGLRDINRRNRKLKLDILIVGRGGGSMEDLWAFNEEVLARAIFDSKIAVISAVGHEVDTTIADLVADARASTPTKAGVVAVPDMRQVQEDLKIKKVSLNRNIILGVQYRGQQLDDEFTKLVNVIKELLAEGKDNLHHFYEEIIRIEPQRLLRKSIVGLQTSEHRIEMAIQLILNKATQSFNDKAATLKNAIGGLLANTKQKLQLNREEIERIRPEGVLRKKSLELSNMTAKVSVVMKVVVGELAKQVIARENKLAGLNPKSVLQRGYSITTNKRTGLLVKNIADVQISDYVITELAGGNLIESEVKNKQNRNK